MKKNVKAVVSAGGSCFLCERPTNAGEFVIQITFNAKVKDPIFGATVATVPMTEEAHVRCGKEFRDVLDDRIDEATSRGGRK